MEDDGRSGSGARSASGCHSPLYPENNRNVMVLNSSLSLSSHVHINHLNTRTPETTKDCQQHWADIISTAPSPAAMQAITSGRYKATATAINSDLEHIIINELCLPSLAQPRQKKTFSTWSLITKKSTPQLKKRRRQLPSLKKPRPSKKQRQKRSADLTDGNVPPFKKVRPPVPHPEVTLRPQAVAQVYRGNDVQRMFYVLMDALDDQKRRMLRLEDKMVRVEKMMEAMAAKKPEEPACPKVAPSPYCEVCYVAKKKTFLFKLIRSKLNCKSSVEALSKDDGSVIFLNEDKAELLAESFEHAYLKEEPHKVMSSENPETSANREQKQLTQTQGIEH
ncbi:hypothetical protein Y032_0854g2704 [Ancylostoma ceylanicum]|uniref:Uncharacterized protein n=1 Tax=Ancylostoma ceylanicum TaxID=53326 RepID=A0A016WB05_9BILA|nr:hypothetical protein Y032_0854g2704 [Ancylostoma ceylanicum]